MRTDVVAMDIGAPEKVLRTIAVYLVLALLLRLAGKRDLAQLNSFDLVVMLLLSNVVQNAVIGPDNSLLGGLLGAAVLVAFNALMVRVSVLDDRTSAVLEGTPTTLASDGRWDRRTLRRLGLRQADVDAALRRQNANDVTETESVVLQPGGAVVATVRPDQQALTVHDLDGLRDDRERMVRIEAKLDRLLAGR